MTAIVEIQGLRKVYRRARREDVVAVGGIDLTLGTPGTVHGFLGPNGSGKTTTIRCLLGLVRPTGGDVRVFGVNSVTEFYKAAPRVGAMVENPKMFPNFSGRKNLRLLADLAGIESAEVDRVLGVVGLADRDGDSFDSYSLGMKQRLAIAAALLKNPDLLILDEPANGLDPAGIAEMRVLIRGIASEGKAVLVSSHQLAEIEQVCDDVTIIHRGNVVVSGTLDHVRQHAGPDMVVASIAEREQAIAILRESGIDARPRPKQDEIAVDIEVSRASDVTRTLADSGLYLSGLRTEQATLEAAFLNLTGDAPPPPSIARKPKPNTPPSVLPEADQPGGVA